MRKQYLLHSYKLLTCRMKGLYGNFSAKLVIVFSNKIVWKKKNLGNVWGRIIFESREPIDLLYLLFAKRITNYQQYLLTRTKIWNVSRNSNGIESKTIWKIILANASSRMKMNFSPRDSVVTFGWTGCPKRDSLSSLKKIIVKYFIAYKAEMVPDWRSIVITDHLCEGAKTIVLYYLLRFSSSGTFHENCFGSILTQFSN